MEKVLYFSLATVSRCWRQNHYVDDKYSSPGISDQLFVEWESPPKIWILRRIFGQLLSSVTFQGRCIGVSINFKNIKWVLYECIFWVKWSIINSRSSIKSSEFHIWNSIYQNKMKILLFVFGLVLSNECYSCKGNSLDSSKESKDCFDDTKLNNANYKCTYGKYSCQVIRFPSSKFENDSRLHRYCRWLHRCWWRMLETKSAGDNFEILVTVYAIFVPSILHLLTLDATNIEKFCHQDPTIVTNIMSTTSVKP